MRCCITTTKAGRAGLLALLLVCALLAACGGPEPAPTPLDVTRPPSTPTGLPAAPTAEPAPTQAQVEFEGYEHPSGAFRLDLPRGAAVEADEEGISTSVDGSRLIVRFAVPEEPLAGDRLKAAIPPLLDAVLVEGGLISSFSDLEIQGNQAGDKASGRMAVVAGAFEGEAEVRLWQVEHVLYTMILVMPDHAAALPFWTRAVDSLAPSVERVALPTPQPTDTPTPQPTDTPSPQPTDTPSPQPTDTPRPQPTDTPRPQPTDTPHPQPTDTPRPQPTSPPPPPTQEQGCYLIENAIAAELTITFTAQDRQWNDTIKVPASGSQVYCLDPGRYTYTIDAPPPWSSINGELTVNPGDRYRWPVRGG